MFYTAQTELELLLDMRRGGRKISREKLVSFAPSLREEGSLSSVNVYEHNVHLVLFFFRFYLCTDVSYCFTSVVLLLLFFFFLSAFAVVACLFFFFLSYLLLLHKVVTFLVYLFLLEQREIPNICSYNYSYVRRKGV